MEKQKSNIFHNIYGLNKRLLIDIEIKLEKINELVREGLSEKVSVHNITYRYIDSSCHNFENLSPSMIFLSELLGPAMAPQPSKDS